MEDRYSSSFRLSVPPSVDELGPKISEALKFAIDHTGGKNKQALTAAERAVVGAGLATLD